MENFNFEKRNNLEKLKKLDEIRKEVDKITDGLGKPVDKGIKEAVVMFKANGFNTTNSCEGHIDRGRPYAFVDVDYIRLSEYEEKEKLTLINELKSKGYKVLEDFKESDKELLSRINEFKNKIKIVKKEVEIKLNSLLGMFYSTHKPLSDDYTLKVWEGGSVFEICPQSGAGIGLDDWEKFDLKIKSMSQDEIRDYLKDSKEEMNAFAGFLKDKFLESM